MAISSETYNKDLYSLIKTKGYRPIPLDFKGEKTDPEQAVVFEFQFKKDGEKYGVSYVTVDNDVTVYYDEEQIDSPSTPSKDLDYDDTWTGFLKQLKQWAMNKQLGFDLQNKDRLGDDLAQRKYTMDKEKINEGYYPMGKTASYNDAVPTVKIILQHTRQIQEGEQRFRNVAKIFLENQLGERILAPTTRPGIAQVYARHLAEGGVPNDERWNHIKGLCEEYSKMAGFVRAVKNHQFNESAQQLVSEGVNHYTNLRETLSRMRGQRGYNTYFESWTPTLMEDESSDNTLNELFVQETLDPRIESVLPILSKLRKSVAEMKEVDELAEWADNLTEAPGAMTLKHNQNTEKSNLKAFDLEEDDDAVKAGQVARDKIKKPAFMRKAAGDKPATLGDVERSQQHRSSQAMVGQKGEEGVAEGWGFDKWGHDTWTDAQKEVARKKKNEKQRAQRQQNKDQQNKDQQKSKQQGVAEGSGGNWYVRVRGKVLKDKQFNAIPFSSEEAARTKAMEIYRKKRIPLEMIKITQSWMDGPETQGVAEGIMKSLAIKLLDKKTPQEVANSAISAINKKASGTKMHGHPNFVDFKREVHRYVSAADSGSEAVRRSSDDHVKSLFKKYFSEGVAEGWNDHLDDPDDYEGHLERLRDLADLKRMQDRENREEPKDKENNSKKKVDEINDLDKMFSLGGELPSTDSIDNGSSQDSQTDKIKLNTIKHLLNKDPSLSKDKLLKMSTPDLIKMLRQKGLTEMDSQGYKGHRGDEDPGKGPEKVVKPAKAKDVAKDAEKELTKAMDKEHKKGVAEDLDANQKRVGQLGPTEPVGKNEKNLRGKLVGNESVEHDPLKDILRLSGK